ncbi:MAG: hypothetical protein ACYTFK_04355 [Planctomycetota bacterium]
MKCDLRHIRYIKDTGADSNCSGLGDFILPLTIVLTATACLFFAGCAAPRVDEYLPPAVCPDKKTVGQALEILQRRKEDVMPVRAGGNMTVQWPEGENKTHRENLVVDLRFYPPGRIYFRGNNVLGEAVRLGADNDQFWMLMKPKEISTYHWGKRRDIERCAGSRWMNPQNFIEALGVLSVDGDWSLSNQGDFDILTKSSPGRGIAKKIHLNCSDYLARRIEYYDDRGQVALTLELNDYTRPAGAAPVPTKINVTHHEADTVVEVTLKNIRLFEPSPKQLSGLFTRPESKGFENVFELNENCEFIRQ